MPTSLHAPECKAAPDVIQLWQEVFSLSGEALGMACWGHV
jgi:hypothetical protein